MTDKGNGMTFPYTKYPNGPITPGTLTLPTHWLYPRRVPMTRLRSYTIACNLRPNPHARRLTK